MAVMSSGSRADTLRDVTVPALVMHGSADTPPRSERWAPHRRAHPGARFVLLEGMGHDYPEAYWDEWVELVTTHVSDAEAARR